MNAKKIAEDVKPFLPFVIVLILILIFSKYIKGFLHPFSSKNNLDKLKGGALAQVQAMNNSPIIPSIANQSDANTIHELLDTYYSFDFLTNIVSNSKIRTKEAVEIFNVLVKNKTGRDVAGTIKAYNARNLPNRTGSLSGILYDNSYGTLRDHVSRYEENGTVRDKTLSYIDKVIQDYL